MDHHSLKTLIIQGLSSHKIAKQLNLSQTTIRYWFKKYNLKTTFKSSKRKTETEKSCSICKVILPINRFYKSKTGLYRSNCKDCGKLAFELNGIFHYEPIYGEEKLKQIKNNDDKKAQLCQEKNIKLYTIDISKQSYFKESSSIKFLQMIESIIQKNW